MKKVFEWTIGLILSLIFVGIMGFMLVVFSPKIAQEVTEENENLFI